MHQEDERDQETRDVQPMQAKESPSLPHEGVDPMAQILAEMKSRWGTDYDEEVARRCIQNILASLSAREELKESLRGKEREEAVPIFYQAMMEVVQSLLESTYKLMRLRDNEQAFAFFARQMFLHYLHQHNMRGETS